MSRVSIESLLARFFERDRSALAQSITIVESTTPHDRALAALILKKLPKTKKTIRVAISGPPGVGKSTFINTLGQKIVELGFYLGVLPIDPSSEYSHGSILGDKIRMKELLSSDRVFIRPAPSKGIFGGVALSTPDTITVMEAFGCDFLLIETVGVGQSEAMAHSLADHFVLLLEPNSGDAVQLMKKGILESADFILVNKVDEHQGSAEKAVVSLKGFKNSSHQSPFVQAISALTNEGVDDFLKKLLKRHKELLLTGELLLKRTERRKKLFYFCFEQRLNQVFRELSANKLGIFEGFTNSEHNGFLPEIDHMVEAIIKKI